MIVRRGPSGLVNLTTAGPGAVSPGNLPFIVRWSFLLFIGSLALDTYSSAKLSGLLFFAVYLLYHNPLSRKRSLPPVPPVMSWFVIYVAIYALNGLFVPTEYLSEVYTGLVTLVQVIIFVWIASDILQDEKMAKKTLVVYSIASVILAFGFMFSVPGFNVEGEVGDTRASAVGMSANLLAGIMALGMVATLGLWLNLAHKRLITGVWMVVFLLALSTALVYTGSRGAFVMAVIGLSVYLVPYWKSRWRMSATVVGIIAIVALGYVAVTSPVFYERWQEFSEEGDTAGRDTIHEHALDMISEKPLFGWQPVEFRYELGWRTGIPRQRDAHNTYLHLFMEVGVVGAAPFLVGLWLCGQGAWKARNRNLGLLPLALLVAILAGSMSSTWIYHKTMWFVLAVAVAARGERKRPDVILVGRPIENGIKTSSWKLSSSTPDKVSSLVGQQRSRES
jgi:O-antigen ligase